jgi:flagellar motility protein MotE (MotC chaperone)
MSLRVRIIPLTIVVASLFMMFKLVALVQGGQEMLLVSRVQAQDQKPEEAKPAEAAPEEKPEEDKNANPNVSSTPGDISDRRFTNVELELLQKLSKRREELDAWEANLQIKDTALAATERRIDEKILQVEAMKKAVSEALIEYNKIEDQQISSLVKIYENMKPADAARIFNELERPILLLIVNRMQEKKAAPILAQMEPRRAKQVTIDLADQRRLKSNAIGTPAGSSPLDPTAALGMTPNSADVPPPATPSSAK